MTSEPNRQSPQNLEGEESKPGSSLVRAKKALGRSPLGTVKREVARAVRNPKEAPERFRRKSRARKQRRQDYRKFIRKEFRWETSFSNRRPSWWRKGFLSRSVTLYDLENNDPSLYVNDIQRYSRTKRMVHPFLQESLDNKFNFFLLIGQLGLESDVVDFLGLYTRRFVHRFPSAERYPLETFLKETLEREPRIFVKPLRGAEATGVRSIRRSEGAAGGYVFDGDPASLDDIVAWIRSFDKPMLFEAAVRQHEFQAAINPEAVNTIRVLTMPDLDKDGEPFIAAAVHRFGTRKSGHVDNWVRGGLSAKIDVETGELSKAAQMPEGTELEWFEKHPDTGVQIAGEQVPMWDRVVELVLEAAERLSFLEYIGWDIILSPTGPVILEANINSGMNVIQVHGPLLADPRAYKYYKARHVI